MSGFIMLKKGIIELEKKISWGDYKILAQKVYSSLPYNDIMNGDLSRSLSEEEVEQVVSTILDELDIKVTGMR